MTPHGFPRRWAGRAAGWSVVALLSAACSAGQLEPTAPERVSQPGPPALAADGTDFSPDEVLVRLAPRVRIASVNRRYRTQTIAAVQSEAIFLLRVPSGSTVNDLLPQMTADPALAVAEPNFRMENPEAQGSSMTFADPALDAADYSDQEALARIRADEAQGVARGTGVIVAVLDTGIEAGHPLLAGRIAPGGTDFVDGDADPADGPDGIDSDGDGLVDEAVGHGTFVAGLVLSVAPEASILPVRVLDSDGFGTSFAVARGIDLARRRGARVVNMSFRMDVVSGVVDGLIEKVKNLDVAFVASAGNQNGEQPQQFPARDSYVIGTAATDPQDRKANFSNFGSWVDVSAPGVGLVSLFPGNAFATWSGTSFAGALVSGEAALLFSAKAGARFNDVVDAIEESAVPIDALNPAYAGELGEGRIDVLAAVNQIQQP